MLTLYGTAGSGSAAVELALDRCGLAYRLCHASSWEAASAQDELRLANPLAQIPTLVLDDGTVLTESAAILIHLGLAHPQAGLLPAGESARAQTIRGLVFIAANCYAAIGVIDYPERWCIDGDEATLKSIRAGARARLHRYWDIFADQFQGQPYLGGETPGALDCLACVVSRWSGTRAHLRVTRPQLLAAFERMQARPEVAAVFARHWPEPAP